MQHPVRGAGGRGVCHAPVLPIHPRCRCAYCVPEDGDEAEITASGANLDEVYARHGVKGYESGKPYTPRGRRAAEVARENGLISASELAGEAGAGDGGDKSADVCGDGGGGEKAKSGSKRCCS